MKGIEVELGERSYPIYVESKLLSKVGLLAKKHNLGRKVALVTDVNVAKYYREEVENGLEKHQFQVLGFIIPGGEESKSLKIADYLYEKLIESGFDRNSVIISLGGGVVGDLAGFVAATYMRGIDFVQIPTTLLAQTDSSVGGKVGINHQLGKNLIGAFHQPKFVLIDSDVLKTLPQRELWAGMAEVVKYGLIFDAEFFQFVRENLNDLIMLKNTEDVEMIIEHCCGIKAHIVQNDERESGLRRILNFGHTVGHALEALTEYSVFRHGEAVVLGMRTMAWLSHKMKLLNKADFTVIDEVLHRMQVPDELPDFSPRQILNKMYKDKKVADGVLNVVLLDGIGSSVVRNDVTEKMLLSALEYLRKQILVKNLSNHHFKTLASS